MIKGYLHGPVHSSLHFLVILKGTHKLHPLIGCLGDGAGHRPAAGISRTGSAGGVTTRDHPHLPAGGSKGGHTQQVYAEVKVEVKCLKRFIN